MESSARRRRNQRQVRERRKRSQPHRCLATSVHRSGSYQLKARRGRNKTRVDMRGGACRPHVAG
uniref:Uncharacterized protein n=1 Tax=Arundo donax TaxID=35708 RepID=A0A0A9FQG6_ARUDO